MDPNTGKIYGPLWDEMAAEMKRRGFIEIPLEEQKLVERMNRHERRAWAAQQRRKEKSRG